MLNDSVTIISFYTNTWEYPKYAKIMEDDCKRLGVKSHIVQIEDTGSWIDNTCIKPKFILDTINKLKTPVLWVDADGMICQTPTYSNTNCDWGACKRPRTHDRMWYVGTLYFNYTTNAIKMLESWVEATKLYEGSDELALDELWKSYSDSISIDVLPEEYFQMMNANNPDPFRNTVIAHRASKGDSKKEYMLTKKIDNKDK